MRLTIAFKNITLWEITKRSLLIAFKEDNSASLVIYTNALVFKNTYEVVLNQSLRFLQKLCFLFLISWRKTSTNSNSHTWYSENLKQGGQKLPAKFRFHENSYKKIKISAYNLIQEQNEKWKINIF